MIENSEIYLSNLCCGPGVPFSDGTEAKDGCCLPRFGQGHKQGHGHIKHGSIYRLSGAHMMLESSILPS